MINIPFNRCVIVTTLNFAQITDRLESAIYDPQFLPSIDRGSMGRTQCYLGKIQGFKFLATRIIGFRNFHLPLFLSPTIEGKIDSLHHGYEISLQLKLQNITIALLLTCFGGLLTTISAILDNMLTGTKNYQYLTTIEMIIIAYLVVLPYFYFAAGRETKFFKTLFIKGFAAASDSDFNTARSSWGGDFQLQRVGNASGSGGYGSELVTDFLLKNLPSIPTSSPKSRDRQPQNPRKLPELRDLLKQNLPSFPSSDRTNGKH